MEKSSEICGPNRTNPQPTLPPIHDSHPDSRFSPPLPNLFPFEAKVSEEPRWDEGDSFHLTPPAGRVSEGR